MKMDKKTTEKNPDITERKRKEEEASRMVTVVRDSNDAIMIQDYEGNILAWNRGAEHLFGYSEKEALKMKIWRLVPPNKAAEQKDFSRRIFADEKVSSFETQRVTKDGRILDIWMTVTKLVDDTGKPVGIASTERDITERKKREEALSSSEAFLNSVIEMNPGSIWVSDSEGTMIRMNLACRELFGVTEEEAVGKYNLFKDNLIEEQGFMPLVEDVFRKGEIARFTIDYDLPRVEHIKVSGAKHRIIDVVISPIKDMHGKVTNAIVQHKDITERKRTEESLQESKEKYSKAFQVSPNAIMITRAKDGKIMEVNDTFSSISGFTREEALLNSSISLSLWANIEDRKWVLSALKDGVEVKNKEFQFKIKNGNLITGLFSSRVIHMAGEPYILSSILDITERKRAEETLREREEVYRTTLMSVGDGVITTDAEGRVRLLNPVAETLTGWSQEDARGRPLKEVFRIVNEETRKGVEDPVSRVVREGMVVGLANHTLLIARDGKEHPIADSGAPIRDAGGALTGVVLVFRDQTAERAADRALRESSAKFRDTVKYLDEGYYSCTMEGLVLDHNLAFNRILGIDLNRDMKGAKLPDFWQDPEDRKVYLKEFMATGSINTYPINAKKSNGEKIVVMASSHLVKDEKGNPVRIEGTFLDITERKRAEQALLLKNIVFDASIAANSIADMNGTITEANDAFLRVWGYPSKDEVIGKPLPQFINDQKEAIAIVTALNNTGQWEGDYTAKRKDGSTFIAHGQATTVKDEKGTVIGYQSAVMDVTGQREAEEEIKKLNESLERRVRERTSDLKRSEEKFRTVSDFTYDWEYWIGPDRNIIYMSPSCERITGFPPEKFYDDSGFMDTIVHLEDKPSFEKHVDTSHYDKQHEEACEIEFRIDSRDGSVKWMAHACRPIIGEDGTYKGRRVSNRDITERKNIEERLLRLQEEQQIILDSIPAWVFYKDKENRFIRVNNAFTKVMEMSRKQIEGKSCFDFYPKEQAEAFLSDDLAVIDSGKPKRNIIESMDSPKGTVWVQTDKIPYRDAQGKIIGIIGFTLDITERKKAENEIIELNVALTRRKTELEASNKELESFAYSVSHDLRAPLRTIDGFSLALLEDYDDKLDVQGKNYLRRVRASTQMMAQLIDDMLKLSRITRTEMNIDKVDLTRIARFVIDELQKSQPERLINIKIADGLEDMADSRLMRVALENLLGNAWKFTGKQPEAVIEFGATKEGEMKVYFIRDNGAGFDMAYVDKLFAPFQRLHTMEEYPGTGVGLATVRRIINRHGGRVWAEGQVGKGATFYFSLQG
jgi:PAS domain S-box-containing protein